MSNKHAVIENSMVINTVLAEDDYALSQGWIKVDDTVCIGWSYDGNTFQPSIIPEEHRWSYIRSKRDMLLTQSDTYVLPDRWTAMTPEKQQEWTTYRQALRDIPQTFATPEEVVWPTKPE